MAATVAIKKKNKVIFSVFSAGTDRCPNHRHQPEELIDRSMHLHKLRLRSC